MGNVGDHSGTQSLLQITALGRLKVAVNVTFTNFTFKR